MPPTAASCSLSWTLHNELTELFVRGTRNNYAMKNPSSVPPPPPPPAAAASPPPPPPPVVRLFKFSNMLFGRLPSPALAKLFFGLFFSILCLLVV